MFNKIILVGNLTKDIQIGYSQQGTAYAKSSIAVTKKYRTQKGELAEDTCFIDLVFFGKTAEVANQYLNKGSKILIEGRLKFDTWIDDYGKTKSKHSVAVESLEMLGTPQKQDTQGAFNQYSQNNQNIFKSEPPKVEIPKAEMPKEAVIYDENGDEIPF
ncbi:single-stranded DNA-binding protein [Campylobacter gastrosuis]|uniref:Single-stranded DNA-binding protein n=1 Tax=Campylobacter gastrosuis TaxID=2974576 RepID=A0ABT7HQP7_9BACT|nr:single-stranded DNA-binding protein [Campylobacter gastrosuis]MDL0089190.1 single-stranded DNA-binding protein [Campylobacter gastrosuis]